MKLPVSFSLIAISLLAASPSPAKAAIAFDSASGNYSVSYDLTLGYLPTSGGNILNTFVFEWDAGGSFNLDSGFVIPGRTTTTISHLTSFAPSSAFLIGYTLGVPGVGDEKDHIFTFVNSDFANSAYGNKWSTIFPGETPATRVSHSAMVSLLVDASKGDSLAIGNLTNFVRSEGSRAAFDPAGGSAAIEWSIAVPEPSAAALVGLAGFAFALRRRRR